MYLSNKTDQQENSFMEYATGQKTMKHHPKVSLPERLSSTHVSPNELEDTE